MDRGKIATVFIISTVEDDHAESNELDDKLAQFASILLQSR